jgi:hypothetical protein
MSATLFGKWKLRRGSDTLRHTQFYGNIPFSCEINDFDEVIDILPGEDPKYEGFVISYQKRKVSYKVGALNIDYRIKTNLEQAAGLFATQTNKFDVFNIVLHIDQNFTTVCILRLLGGFGANNLYRSNERFCVSDDGQEMVVCIELVTKEGKRLKFIRYFTRTTEKENITALNVMAVTTAAGGPPVSFQYHYLCDGWTEPKFRRLKTFESVTSVRILYALSTKDYPGNISALNDEMKVR